MSIEREDESNDEWNAIACSYEDVLRPRFEPLYICMASLVAKQIQSNNEKYKAKVLDYGTGPGEPILTIMKMLETNKIFNVELRATDPSSKMLSVAEDRLSKLNKQHLTVQFSSFDHSLNSNMYDIITMSLVLPYSSDKSQMIRDRFNQLNPKGLLISSHWPHPSQVPFLTTTKRIINFMANGGTIDISQFESNDSFSCWREETIRQLFMAEGFTIEEWIPLNLPMVFQNIHALLSFCGMCSWFNNETLYRKAEEETKRILHENHELQFNSNGSFQLPNTVIVVAASKPSL